MTCNDDCITTLVAKTTVWSFVPTDSASILLSKYFSEKILFQHIVNDIVSPGCYRSLSLFDGSVAFQCVAVCTIESFGWSFSEQKVLVTQNTKVILLPIGSSRVLQPLSSLEPSELIDPPEALKRCQLLITWRLCQQVMNNNNMGNFPCLYVFRGYAKCGRKTFLLSLAKELNVLCVVFRATYLYNLFKDSINTNWYSERWKCLEPCIIIIEDCDWLWEEEEQEHSIINRVEETNPLIEGIKRLSMESHSIVVIASCDASTVLPNSIISLSGMIVNFSMASEAARKQILAHATKESFLWTRKEEEMLDASHGLTVGELKDSLAAITDLSNQRNWLKAFWQRKREQRMDNLTLLGVRILFPNQLDDETSLSGGHLYGLDSILQQLEMSLFPSRYASNLLTNMRGILFYGPPGTGKTSLAKKLAHSVRATFISVDVSNLIDSYVGESERLLRMLFHRANEMAPCVVFFDEIDSLFNKRQRSPETSLMRWRSSFILEMDDDRNEQVYIMAATNRPWDLDQSLLQEGRLSKHFYVTLPDVKARTQILMHHFQHLWPSWSPKDTLLLFAHRIAEMTEDFSGADLEGLVRSAVLVSCRKRRRDKQHAVSEEDVLEARGFCQPCITMEEKLRYETWQQSSY